MGVYECGDLTSGVHEGVRKVKGLEVGELKGAKGRFGMAGCVTGFGKEGNWIGV